MPLILLTKTGDTKRVFLKAYSVLKKMTEDLSEFRLHQGEQGTVVEVFDDPEEAYVLEFVDESDASSKLAYGIRPDQIINVAPYVDAEELWQHISLYAQGGCLQEEKTY